MMSRTKPSIPNFQMLPAAPAHAAPKSRPIAVEIVSDDDKYCESHTHTIKTVLFDGQNPQCPKNPVRNPPAACCFSGQALNDSCPVEPPPPTQPRKRATDDECEEREVRVLAAADDTSRELGNFFVNSVPAAGDDVGRARASRSRPTRAVALFESMFPLAWTHVLTHAGGDEEDTNPVTSSKRLRRRKEDRECRKESAAQLVLITL
jgi:hypothetical protein